MESLFVFTTMAIVNSKYINYRSLKWTNNNFWLLGVILAKRNELRILLGKIHLIKWSFKWSVDFTSARSIPPIKKLIITDQLTSAYRNVTHNKENSNILQDLPLYIWAFHCFVSHRRWHIWMFPWASINLLTLLLLALSRGTAPVWRFKSSVDDAIVRRSERGSDREDFWSSW